MKLVDDTFWEVKILRNWQNYESFNGDTKQYLGRLRTYTENLLWNKALGFKMTDFDNLKLFLFLFLCYFIISFIIFQ